MQAVKVQASLCIRAVSPEPPLLTHTSSESRGTFRQKARSLASLNDCACAVKICHDGMLEDTNSLDVAHVIIDLYYAMKLSGNVTDLNYYFFYQMLAILLKSDCICFSLLQKRAEFCLFVEKNLKFHT